MLSNCDDIIRQHKAACLRVTSLLACKDLIWVGTSAGVLLTIAGSNISKGSSPPSVTGRKGVLFKNKCTKLYYLQEYLMDIQVTYGFWHSWNLRNVTAQMICPNLAIVKLILSRLARTEPCWWYRVVTVTKISVAPATTRWVKLPAEKIAQTIYYCGMFKSFVFHPPTLTFRDETVVPSTDRSCFSFLSL